MDEYTKKLLLKAKTYFKQKNYKKALIHYDKILKLDSQSIEALSMKGQIFFENKDYENAIKYFNKALKINPKQSKILLGCLMKVKIILLGGVIEPVQEIETLVGN